MEQPFLNAVYSNIHHTNFIMTFCAPQFKAEYLTECLLEVVNNQWKLDITKFESYSKLEYSVGKKYIKVKQIRMHRHGLTTDNGVFMFIDKETGACYKPASFKAPAKGIRFWIDQLVMYPEMVDPYGSFLYVR
jgi:hypothetical protein